ncbi:unnamed protein product, partial [marine sediment metagenome]
MSKRISIAILGLVNDWKRFNSKIFLQKFLFFLNDLNWKKIQLNFELYYHGPYDSNVEGYLQSYSKLSLVSIYKNGLNTIIETNQGNIMKYYESIGGEPKSNKFDDKLEYKVLDVFNELKELNYIGLFSSIHFIITDKMLFKRTIINDNLIQWKGNQNSIELQYLWRILIE